MIKTPLYASVIIGAFVSTLSAADALDGRNADTQAGLISTSTRILPDALQQFVCHETLSGISGNVLLRLTKAQYDEHCSEIARLSYVSFMIIKEDPSVPQTIQEGSQASIATTERVNFSQDSQETPPPTIPAIITEES